MIGVVIVAHGGLAEALLAATEHVVGPLEGVCALGIDSDADIEDCRQAIRNAVHQVDRCDRVLVLADVFGGTPANLAISLMDDQLIDVVCGANLPMLIKLASARNGGSLHAAATAARDAGRKYIALASEMRRSGTKEGD